MLLELYGIIFWLCAMAFTAFRSKSETRNILATILKMIPAISAAVFVLLSDSTLFYLLLAAALIFCSLGDAGMEINILPGLGLFLISHFIYTGNFMYHGLVGASATSLAAFAVCFGIMLVYLFFYFRYVKTAQEPMPRQLLSAAYLYAIMIILTTSSSLLLWLSWGVQLGFLPFIGALFFVASDSMIVIKEYHHHFKFDKTFVHLTYYIGIFLLSLGASIYLPVHAMS